MNAVFTREAYIGVIMMGGIVVNNRDPARVPHWNALTYALIGGLLSSTLFVLTTTPAFYLLVEGGPSRKTVGASAVTRAMV